MMADFYRHEHITLDPPRTTAAIAELLADPSLGRIALIEEGTETIGYVVVTFGFSLEFHGRDALVDELYLRGDHRGRGLGSRTIAWVESLCRSLSIRFLHLEVDHENARAKALYHRLGFADHRRHLLTKPIPPGDT
jgi:ribosomal protein S18 acetylase RimI-like enzyme